MRFLSISFSLVTLVFCCACQQRPSPANSDHAESWSPKLRQECIEKLNKKWPKAASSPRVSEVRTQTLGIDVSHFQTVISWDEIKQARISYVYTKATEGVSLVDSKYHVNREGTAKAGLAHGAYHFFSPHHDGAEQAAFFVSVVKTLEADAMPPVLDLEQGRFHSCEALEKYQTDIVTWLKQVEEAFGVKPIVYTNRVFSDAYLHHPEIANYPLWIAEYGVAAPKVPKLWQHSGWLMWQRTSSKKIEGSLQEVDLDVLLGTPKDR